MHVLAVVAGLVLMGTESWAACPFSSQSSSNTTWLGQIPAASNESDPLVRMNDIFHDVYSQSSNQLLPATLVFQEGDYLVLLRSDGNGNFIRNLTAPIVPRNYHDLKMVAHVPLTVFVVLWPYLTGIQTFPLQKLTEYRTSLTNALPALRDGRFSDASMLSRQVAMVTNAINFLNRFTTRQGVSVQDLQTFVRAQMGSVTLNLQDAAKLQIDLLLQVIADWRDNILTPQEWLGLRFVSGTDHMARTMGLVAQVFARVLANDPAHPNIDPSEPNSRFIVADNPSDERTVVDLLARHIIDYAAGDMFFQDTYRLHRDALADAAQAYLDQIFGSH